jgi:hypothetical protein
LPMFPSSVSRPDNARGPLDETYTRRVRTRCAARDIRPPVLSDLLAHMFSVRTRCFRAPCEPARRLRFHRTRPLRLDHVLARLSLGQDFANSGRRAMSGRVAFSILRVTVCFKGRRPVFAWRTLGVRASGALGGVREVAFGHNRALLTESSIGNRQFRNCFCGVPYRAGAPGFRISDRVRGLPRES